MANMFIYPSRALNVIPSSNSKVPFPAITVSGTDDTAPVGNQLVDSTKDFVALNVRVGDIVYNESTNQAATVLKTPVAAAADTIELNAAIFTGVGNTYKIYQSGEQSGAPNRGCSLFVGTGGNLVVTTAGGDDVTFFNIQDGTLIPIQVIKVWGTTSASNIIALW